ncbi:MULTISPECIES: phosphoglycerate mutase family protein [Bacillus cereus group]|uniref:phosphoglycerate mutase family protein n=1 Tax=Bacillus cereus group TaxID=86661 RepID=UPI000BEBF27F|nr:MULTISPECIES: phosphoglycerate mutase family protein [Bacillus cereus group]MEB9947575.1 phosphoglycerate mutase family protein [Bacillus cereus]PDY77433.1 histidine phosphatase family protein [Bacillus cereus]PDZ53599.1 histidine phosphatase family protein [Bacillus cereus]PEC78443.1 histidine phosphatase family protein [Bacillus cereus]PEC87907.1 histidine phosphatase family protein [Bacillus cereus]
MKLIFLRHGEAEHNINEPDSFQIQHPRLTLKGITQVQNFKKNFNNLVKEDIIVASPTYRTLETAELFTKEYACRKYICYAIGPRIYPYRESAKTLPCDVVMKEKELSRFSIANSFGLLYKKCFDENLISVNHVSERHYQDIALSFLDWCRAQERKRIFLVTHDGTINTFKELILNKKFTRDDMLNEGEFVTLDI